MTLIDRIIRPEIRALSGYVVAPAAGMIKLDAMENPFALPAPIRTELGAALAAASLNRYPPAGAERTRALLRATMGVPAGYDVLLGNGSDELIHLVIQACAKPGAVVLSPAPAFVMYEMSSRFDGVKYVAVDLQANFQLDLKAMLAAIARHAPAIIFLAYPNNPTGTLYTDHEIETILAAAPGLVVIDEAYQPFAGSSYLSRLPEFDNLLVMRTLSKLGLAGIRLGYMSARDDLLAEFDKVRPPYNVNVLTQTAVEVVLGHLDVLDAQAAVLCEQRALMSSALAALPGVTVYPSAANFVLLRFAGGTPQADAIFEYLKSQGILVKNMSKSHVLLHGCLRLTIGSPEENQSVLLALRAALT